MEIVGFSPDYTNDIVALWKRCGLVVEHNDPRKDIERKQVHSPELFLLALMDGRVVGSLMCGYEGHRGWLNYLAIDPELQGQGLGSELVQAGVEKLRQLGCAKINLQVRESNKAAVAFYRQLGFNQDEVVSFGLRLTPD